jgi:hypothetical protein
VKAKRSPTPGLLFGLVVTLAAVVAYTGYITYQIKGLRELQSNIIDRNRKDSLQLLRIQNDLNLLAVAMRDMIDNDGQGSSSASGRTWTMPCGWSLGCRWLIARLSNGTT